MVSRPGYQRGGQDEGQQAGPAFGTISGNVPAVYVGADGRLYTQMFWKGSLDPVVSAGVVNDNQFHHVAVVFDGTTQTVYLDGVALGTKPFTQVAYAASNEEHGQRNVGTTPARYFVVTLGREG